MSERIDPAIRERALAIYAEHGPSEAARQTGVKRETISQWAKRAGVTCDSSETMRAAVEARKLSLAERRVQLAADLMEDAAKLRMQLWSPSRSHHWGQQTVLDDRGKPCAIKPVMLTETLPQPVAADQRNIMTTAAIAIDKSQLLSGEATSRVERLEPEEAAEEIARLQTEWRERQIKRSA